MEREDIAKKINCEIDNITRMQGTNWKEEWTEGQILEVGKDLGMSWTDGGEFTAENDTEYIYLIKLEGKIAGHKVNYEDEDEVYELGAEGCEKEKEVLLPEGTKLRVIYAPNDVDFEIEGIYTVTVEPVED